MMSSTGFSVLDSISLNPLSAVKLRSGQGLAQIALLGYSSGFIMSLGGTKMNKGTVQNTVKLGHSIKNACAMLDLSRGTLHRMIAAGDLRVSRVGKKVIVPHSELERLVNGVEK